jgi:hypothetical protein
MESAETVALVGIPTLKTFHIRNIKHDQRLIKYIQIHIRRVRLYGDPGHCADLVLSLLSRQRIYTIFQQQKRRDQMIEKNAFISEERNAYEEEERNLYCICGKLKTRCADLYAHTTGGA